jgi:hypothetical protein
MQWPRRHHVLKVQDRTRYAAPYRCTGGILGRCELIGADATLGLSLVTVAPEHELRGAPNVDLAYHGAKAAPDTRLIQI